jgi:hypothetical protein
MITSPLKHSICISNSFHLHVHICFRTFHALACNKKTSQRHKLFHKTTNSLHYLAGFISEHTCLYCFSIHEWFMLMRMLIRYMPACSAAMAMLCVRCAMTSSRPLASAMCVASPLMVTDGATPWSAWQNPSASCARVPPTAAPLGRCTMTGRATGRNARIRLAAAKTRRAAS